MNSLPSIVAAVVVEDCPESSHGQLFKFAYANWLWMVYGLLGIDCLCFSPYFVTAQLVELKNGETYNGHLVSCDNWMNVNLREVICTSKVADSHSIVR